MLPPLYLEQLLSDWLMSMGSRPPHFLSASLASLCNALIDFQLGVTNDTSALARVKKELPHIAHNALRICVGNKFRGFS